MLCRLFGLVVFCIFPQYTISFNVVNSWISTQNLRPIASKTFNLVCQDFQGINLARDFEMNLLARREAIGALNMERYYQQPSALLPPHRVVQVQLEALQMNDWPEKDAGCRHAYRFAVRAKNLLFGDQRGPFILKPDKNDPSILTDRIYVDPKFDDRRIVKSWLGNDLREDEESFIATLKQYFRPLIDSSGFRWASSPEFNNLGTSCTIQVLVDTDQGSRSYVFDLTRVDDGAYRDCWMTSGVRAVGSSRANRSQL